jgi:transcriptional regulator with XRE-family HTH domain
MPYHDDTHDPNVKAWMTRFGAAVRAARLDAGLSQERLAGRGAVPQSFISRLEHGLVPYTTLARVARLSIGLEGRLPIGPCPHGHTCAWSEPLITAREFRSYHRRRWAIGQGIIDPRQLDMLDDLDTAELEHPAW